MIFRSRKDRDEQVTVADPAPPVPSVDTSATRGPALEALQDRIDRVTRENADRRDPALERELLKLRHDAGIRILEGSFGHPRDPDAAFARLPNGAPLPAVEPSDLTPELLRAGILTHGCVLVRGLLDRDEALSMATEIDRSFAARAALKAGEPAPEGYYEEFEPQPGFGGVDPQRPWIEQGGGVLAGDSPKVMFELLDALQRVHWKELVTGYLGEPVLMSLQKCTLRKADPAVPGAWHQDGYFLGDVRSLNLWLSLSRCGDEAPGLDIVPRRLDQLVRTGGEGILLNYQVSDETAADAAGEGGVLRPIFEPGDALLFDHLFLHQTGSDPQMPNPRYAIESWFFGRSGFPSDYAALAL